MNGGAAANMGGPAIGPQFLLSLLELIWDFMGFGIQYDRPLVAKGGGGHLIRGFTH
jgi:hypothetical protein